MTEENQKEENQNKEEARNPELETEAADWLPESSKKALFIDNPFRLPTMEVVDAQNQEDGEIELNEPSFTDIEESADDLARIAQAVSAEEGRIEQAAKELAAAIPEVAETDEARLAREIAEDEALAREEAEAANTEFSRALPLKPERDELGQLDLSEVESCIEALLFVTDKPLSQAKLKDILGPGFDGDIFTQALQNLEARYASIHHGIELARVGGGFQLRTKPGRAALAKALAKVQTQRLSAGAMETLSIVAYRQPVLKEEIDQIRGVDSSHFIRGLLDRKLIKISGRSELPGRPMLYSTTPEFLELFGLNDLNALPPLQELEKMVPASQGGNDAEDPRVKQMRKLVSSMNADDSSRLIYDPREDESILREFREKVGAIPISTPYLEEQDRLKKEEEAMAKAATEAETQAAPAATESGDSSTASVDPEPPVES